MSLIFYVPASLVFVVCGIWGFLLCIGIVYDTLGLVVAVLSIFFLFPIVLFLTPWYQGLANNDWMPFAVVYGGSLIGYILTAIGTAVDKDE